jgi:nitronate monooxygenase
MATHKRTILLARAEAFAAKMSMRLPILLAPMAGACPPSLSIAVANAGGMGACGAVLMNPDSIEAWVAAFRQESNGPFQLNLWIPGPPPMRDPLASWGPPVRSEAAEAVLPDFEAQCQFLLSARPTAISSIMGLFSTPFVSEMKSRGISWLATTTTVAEARAPEAAGAEAIIAQGMEAGGHRGTFRAEDAEAQVVGLMALLPQVVDAVSIPVIATGGIADGRGVAAALILGASAVQIGTGFLRTPEAQIHPVWAQKLGQTEAHDTRITRAFSGRPGRSVSTRYVEAAAAPDAPPAAPYPHQRGFVRLMLQQATHTGDADRMQMWSGQSARLAQVQSAAAITRQLWQDALKFPS